MNCLCSLQTSARFHTTRVVPIQENVSPLLLISTVVFVDPAGLETLPTTMENASVNLLFTSPHIHNNDIFVDAYFRFSLTTFSVDENDGPLNGSITLDTSGKLDQQILVVVQIVSSGSAAGKL